MNGFGNGVGRLGDWFNVEGAREGRIKLQSWVSDKSKGEDGTACS